METDTMCVNEIPTGVTEGVAQQLLEWHKRCTVCGSTFKLHIHHRIFRSEGEGGLQDHLQKAIRFYRESYHRELEPWHLHSMQNLVVICQDCHEADGGRGVHGGNEKLRQALRWSFTCVKTGFNVPFYKRPDPFALSIAI